MIRSRSLILSLSLTLLASLSGCSSKGGETSGAAAYADSGDAQVIQRAWLLLEVDSLDESSAELQRLVAAEQGRIESSNRRDAKEVSFNIRVPHDRFDASIARIEALGSVEDKSVSAEDVAGELIDGQARIENLRSLRERLRHLLSQATVVSEIIEIEKELTRVQTELDALEGRRTQMQSLVAYSSLRVTLKQETLYGPLGYLFNGIWWGLGKLFVIR